MLGSASGRLTPQVADITMARVKTTERLSIDRRTFLFGGVAAAMGVAAPASRLETFTDWLNASRRDRERALQPCLDHIQHMEEDRSCVW